MSDDARSTSKDDNPSDETPIDDTNNIGSDSDAADGSGDGEPQVDDAALEEAKKSVEGLDDRYRPGARPTVALPGTNGTVAGTAFADMVDDNGEMVDADDQDSADSDNSDDDSVADHADTDEKVTSSNDA